MQARAEVGVTVTSATCNWSTALQFTKVTLTVNWLFTHYLFIC